MAAYDAAVDRIIANMPRVGVMTTHDIAEHVMGCCYERLDDREALEWMSLLAATAIQRLVAKSD